jgi:mRNA interferase RelE/StbE
MPPGLEKPNHLPPSDNASNVYKVELNRPAARELECVYRADRSLYQRFLTALDVIAGNPSQGKRLQGPLLGLQSYRFGSYRILYETFHSKLLVIVVDLGHRKDIYR